MCPKIVKNVLQVFLKIVKHVKYVDKCNVLADCESQVHRSSH